MSSTQPVVARSIHAVGEDDDLDLPGRALRQTVPRGPTSEAATAGVTVTAPRRDLQAAEQAARAMLHALGVDVEAPAVLETPRRMVAAYVEMMTPRPFDLTTFDNDEHYDELVLARGIPVQALCEHHMLPFTGVAHVGYLPGERILGLSKLARVVELFARRPQVQERLTKQVADWLDAELRPRGVGVVIEAEHSCMSLRGVRAAGTRTVTSTLLGALRADPRSRAEFLSLTTTGPTV